MKITEKQDEKNWISRHKWLSYQLWFSHLILNYKSTFTLIKLLMHSLVAQMVERLPTNVGNPGSIPESGRSPGEGNGNPLQYSCLENLMDGQTW